MKNHRSEYLPEANGARNGAAPHSVEAEAGILSCVLQSPQCMADLVRLPTDFFHDLRHASLFKELRTMHAQSALIDPVSLHQWLKDRKLLKQVGGFQYLVELPDKAPSSANLPYYVSICQEKFALRKLSGVCSHAVARIAHNEANVRDLMLGVQADLDTVSRIGLKNERRALVVHNSKELADHVLDPRMKLIGDNEICTGYDGICLLAGPGGSGKSLATLTLALAGALGTGTWMGRNIHRQFKTLIVQAENGMVRLKTEFEAIRRNHPNINLDDWIFISEPPEGGLPFHRPQFRSEVREIIERLKPDLIILDPWSQVAADDSAKDVVDKLAEIRSCFPAGDDCPGLLISAHTKKPRAEEVRKGRGLINAISGSIALGNTSRCVYMLLPWTDDVEDDRCYWSCVKLNNGSLYAPTVWHRRFGTFFEHDEKTDAREFGRTSEEDERRAITESQLRDAFGKEVELAVRDLVRRLCKLTGCGESTAYKAVNEDGYLRAAMMRAGKGKLKLKET